MKVLKTACTRHCRGPVAHRVFPDGTGHEAAERPRRARGPIDLLSKVWWVYRRHSLKVEKPMTTSIPHLSPHSGDFPGSTVGLEEFNHMTTKSIASHTCLYPLGKHAR